MRGNGSRATGPGFLQSLLEGIFGPPRPLDCLRVEITNRCFGRCTYCPHTTHARAWQPRDMDMALFERLWPAMRQSRRVHLQGWGEPLLHPEFFGMADRARRAGCEVSTTTCGLIMDERTAVRLVDAGLDVAAFSLAGTSPAGNAARRGVDFDAVIRSVDLLQKVRRKRVGVHLEIHFAYLLLASRIDEVRGLPALMEKLGVHAVVISTLDFVPQPDLEAEVISTRHPERLARAAEVLKETALEARRRDREFHFALPRVDAPGNACPENIDRSLCVSVEGLVSPCVFTSLPTAGHRHRTFGDANREDPLRIRESPEFREFRRALTGGDPDPACRDCPKRRIGPAPGNMDRLGFHYKKAK